MDVTHARDAQNTRKVSSLVVAAVVRSVWYDEKVPTASLLVEMKYVSNLCDACFPAMNNNDESDIGIMLTDQIAAIEGDASAGSNIIAA